MKSNQEILLYSDPRCATKATLTFDRNGKTETREFWISLSNQIWSEEHMCRWSSCTHVETEGEVHEKHYTCGPLARERRAWEKYAEAKQVECFSDTPLASEDDFFWSNEELFDYCTDREIKPSDLRLYVATPTEFRHLDGDHWSDSLHEDAELPEELGELIDKINIWVEKYNSKGPYVSYEVSNERPTDSFIASLDLEFAEGQS